MTLKLKESLLLLNDLLSHDLFLFSLHLKKMYRRKFPREFPLDVWESQLR